MQHDLANILIVDDRKENLVATEKVLKHLPATLFAAASGNEALSLMLRHKFAVVILDVQMPGMDGFETASLMQEEETMRGTLIIFATAISKEDRYASRAGDIGAVDYIFKPINPDILRSKVKVYLDLYIQREQIMKLNAAFSGRTRSWRNSPISAPMTSSPARDWVLLLSRAYSRVSSSSFSIRRTRLRSSSMYSALLPCSASPSSSVIHCDKF